MAVCKSHTPRYTRYPDFCPVPSHILFWAYAPAKRGICTLWRGRGQGVFLCPLGSWGSGSRPLFLLSYKTWPDSLAVSALAKREAARSAAHHRGQAGRTSVEQQQDQSPQWLSAADSPLCLPHRRADGVGFLRGPMWVGESGVTLPRLAV